MTQRIAFLDGIRGIAALCVCISHAADLTLLHETRGFELPLVGAALKVFDFGVPMFFVLSGFVIAYALRDAVMTPGYFGRFVARRMIRLDPPYWAAIALAIGTTALIAWCVGDAVRPPQVTVVAAHVAYLQAWLDMPHFNGLFWTLCIEVQFYLAFALLVAVSQRLGLSIGAASVPLLVVSLFTLHPGAEPHWSDYKVSLLPNYALFFLGSTACMSHLGRGGAWFAIGVVACTARLFVEWNEHLAAGLATAVFIWSCRTNGPAWLSSGAVQLLGTISYSLYLVHFPIERFASLVLFRLLPHTAINCSFIMLILIVVSIAASLVFYRLIERPSLRLSKLVGR